MGFLYPCKDLDESYKEWKSPLRVLFLTMDREQCIDRGRSTCTFENQGERRGGFN